MDPDSNKILNDLEIKIIKKRSYDLFNVGNVHESTWIRRAIQTSDGLDKFLLGYGFDFLWRCAFFSWVIFLLQKVF